MTSVATTTDDGKESGGAAKYEFYPIYCNAVSPTLRTWCPLTAHDIFGLQWKVTVESQKYMFFYLNHPISWARIVGVVVAIDSFYGRRIYTIDDSSGACIECCVALPTPDKTDKTAATSAAPPPDPYPDIETGIVVDVKGVLAVFRNEPQIGVVKMARVRSTNAEVAFWGKTRTFREGTLAEPWFVDAAMVRRLKRHNEKDAANKNNSKQDSSGRGREAADNSRERRSRSRRDEGAAKSHTTMRDSPRRHRREEGGGEHQGSRRRKAVGADDAGQEEAIAGQQTEEQRSKRYREDGDKRQWEGNPSLRHKPHRPSKLSNVATYIEGQYDALGL
ncbi:hypothetical protein PG999_004777 [Apiospora kogelbergensis]|uniref:CST complex subunit Stn1 N-terminal domain-containing protein n=1 Tax=Apiospora kogelbergensis TaxID=1337665 RepID=A0AAW0R074_9PEZI